MTKVYRIIPDVNVYQWLLPVDPDIWNTEMLQIDGTSKADLWVAPRVYCLRPNRKKGDFLNFCAGTLAATPSALEKVLGFFEMAGEILPLNWEGVEYPLLNVTECINCLDADNCEWVLNPETKARVLIEKYAFFPDRLTESSLFKIPEQCRANIFTYERSSDPEEEFKAFVERKKMTGLIFEEVWRDE